MLSASIPHSHSAIGVSIESISHTSLPISNVTSFLSAREPLAPPSRQRRLLIGDNAPTPSRGALIPFPLPTLHSQQIPFVSPPPRPPVIHLIHLHAPRHVVGSAQESRLAAQLVECLRSGRDRSTAFHSSPEMNRVPNIRYLRHRLRLFPPQPDHHLGR